MKTTFIIFMLLILGIRSQSKDFKDDFKQLFAKADDYLDQHVKTDSIPYYSTLSIVKSINETTEKLKTGDFIYNYQNNKKAKKTIFRFKKKMTCVKINNGIF